MDAVSGARGAPTDIKIINVKDLQRIFRKANACYWTVLASEIVNLVQEEQYSQSL